METIAQQFGVNWPSFIAQVILFVIVYFVLRKYAFRPIVTMLEERRRRIEEGQLNAERIKKQLAEAQAKYEEILTKARESIEQERERTMVELKRDFGRLVVEVTEKVTKKALTPEDQQRIN